MTDNINEPCPRSMSTHSWQMGKPFSYTCYYCGVQMSKRSEPTEDDVGQFAAQFSQENHMVNMRQRSGSVDSTDPLVGFLYILIRDHVPLGVIEEIMLAHVEYDQSDNQFTNGWLANYCKDLANRLKDK